MTVDGTISSSTSQAIYRAFQTIFHFFQCDQIEYEDFLNNTLNHTPINTSPPLAQIYSTFKTNNKVYNLSEILKHWDKEGVIKAIHKEVASMFWNNTWKVVPKKEMLNYYDGKTKKEATINDDLVFET